MKRNIIYIDKEKCTGCGICVETCHEGAIGIVDGKAQLLSDEYCDGLGNCLRCPEDAISIIQRKADAYDIKKAPKRVNAKQAPLQNWPVQLHLAPIQANYFNQSHLLIAADCTAYAYPNMHQDFIAGKTTLIGCPKLDDNNYYAEKLTQILQANEIKSITVIRMEVPCCTGIVNAVKTAMIQSQITIPYDEVTLTLTGEIK